MSTAFPQLRVRTGYTYRDAYGRMPEVFERLAELDAKTAVIVDASTWGHVVFERAAVKAGVQPAFGMEIPLISSVGEFEKFKPKAWVIATDTRQFYTLASASLKDRGLPSSVLASATGVLRFLGGCAAANPDPSAFDYVDINPSSILSAAQSIRWAREHGKPMVLTSYNDMPDEKHESFAYSWEVRESVGLRHIETVDTIRRAVAYLLSPAEFESALANTYAVESLLQGQSLPKAPMINFAGDLKALAIAGKASRLARGHIAEWTQDYEDRMHMELEQIRNKDFDSYFLVVSDVIRYAKQHMLVGPARGSSAGSLVCYLTDITEVDPMPWGLLFQRFIDVSRADLPDIDIDFADTKRYMVFDYLQKKYGAANVAKVGSINTLKSASVLAQVGKRFGIGINETSGVRNAIIEYSSGDERYGKGLKDTFEKTQPGIDFFKRHPQAAACMGDIEIHPSHAGVHAAGILVCNEPITDFCAVSGEGVAQLDKWDAEYLNLLKIDALGLRTLGIIEDAGVVTNDELYALKYEDQSVLDILNDDKVSGIFQFEGDAVRSVMRTIKIDSFTKIDNLTALARPGPLGSGMWKQYIACANGDMEPKYETPHLEKYLSETYGVFLYQEQIMAVVKDIGMFDWAKTAMIRKAMSGRKGEEFFNKMGADFTAGALRQGVSEVHAEKIWKDMVTFGAWGFNKSHSLSYAIVTYWTMWMKRYYPLAFAAACLRSAKDDEQVISILRELAKEGVRYTPIDTEFSEINWKVADGRLVGGIMNAKGYGPAKALAYVQKREAGTLLPKDVERLASAQVKFSDLAEAHTKWGHYYSKPRLAGVTSGDPIIEMKSSPNRQSVLVIAKLNKKVLADENEAIRIKKRGGKVMKGLTQFIDLMMSDDSTDSSWRFRIRPDLFPKFGLPIAESVPVGAWFLVKAWKIEGLDMFIVKNIKRIDA
jgi:DNA polymerase III alpha subunit